MALAGLENTTGTKTFVAIGEPATFDAAGYAALTWVKVVGVVSFGEWGDSENDISEPLLEDGRVIHTNGVKDGGEVAISIQHRDTDAGYSLIKDNSGGDQIVSIKKEYKSGDIEYAAGVFTSPKQRAASGDSVRGVSVMARINTAVLEVAA